MLNIPFLMASLEGSLPDWNIEEALSMNAIDAKDLPKKVPLLAIYQGGENFSPASGSPASQEVDSEIVFIIVCKQSELVDRSKELRDVLYEWQGDDDYHQLYRKLYAVSGETLDVKGEHIWRRETWVTSYKI